MVGHYRHASEMPFQWSFAGGPMMAHFSGISILSPYPQVKKHKKIVASVGPPETKLSGSARELAWWNLL